MNVPSHSLTVQHNGRAVVLTSDIQVSEAWDPASGTTPPAFHKFLAIWDTGASNTVITQNVANALGLSPTGKVLTSTANGNRLADTYLVNVRLPNAVGFPGVRVTEGTLSGGADVLIGMDIIGMGDFSVTCADGRTCMSFRMPSIKRIDYVEEHNKNQPKLELSPEDVRRERNRLKRQRQGRK